VGEKGGRKRRGRVEKVLIPARSHEKGPEKEGEIEKKTKG